MAAPTSFFRLSLPLLLTVLLLATLLFATPAPAQPQSPDNFRTAALQALGGDLAGLTFSGNGWDACLGQAWSVSEGWARWELTDYQRTINYQDGNSRHTTQRRAGLNPDHIGGCGAQPNASAAPQQGFIGANSAWLDQLNIWLTPHGFLHLAAQTPAAVSSTPDGLLVELPIRRNGIDYRLIGAFNADNQLRTITTWVDDSVFGNMEVQVEYGPYRDYGEVSFPSSLTVSQGGFATLHLDIDAVAPSSETLEAPPPRGGGGGAAPAGPAYSEIGPGIFALHGAYQSVAVEFADYVMVIDGLQNDARVAQIIATVKDIIPNKPIRYVVSTHSHFDHANGLRQFAALGATVLTHDMNVAFFQQALSTPRTLRTDSTEPDTVPVKVQGVGEHLVFRDNAGQTVELYALGASPHAADMLIAYLPTIQTVVEADVLQPWINPVFGGNNGPHPFLIYLADALERLGIDYQRFVPVHVPPDPPLMERAELQAVLSSQ